MPLTFKLAIKKLFVRLSITEKVTQVFRVNNPEQTTVRLRLRIVYKLEGQEVVKMGEAQNIPDSWK